MSRDYSSMSEEQLYVLDWGDSDVEGEFKYNNFSKREYKDRNSPRYPNTKGNSENTENSNDSEDNAKENIEDLPKNIPKKIENNFKMVKNKYIEVVNKTDWSNNAKETSIKTVTRVINEAIGLVKYAKNYCDNPNCTCVEHSKQKVDFNSKKYLVTISYTEAPLDKVLEYYRKKFGIKEIAIAPETHKETTEEMIIKWGTDKHLHLYIEFSARKHIRRGNYFWLPEEQFGQYGNCKADFRVIKKKEKEEVFNYMVKECKEPVSVGFDIQQEVHGKLKDRDIWYRISCGEWSLQDAIKYKPMMALQNVIKQYNDLTINLGTIIKDAEGKYRKRINWLL